jgi:hypothetical protein
MSPSRLFGGVVWLGIAANAGFAFPAILAPDRFAAFFNLEQAVPTIWLRFSGWLLILLSLFYVPAALDPSANRSSAWLSVVTRWAGAAFFLGQIALGLLPRAYWPFGAADLSFGILQLALLTRVTTDSHFSGKRNSWRT